LTLKRKLGLVAALYLIEGFPFGIHAKVWPAYFKVHGVSLTAIGLMSLLALPWSLKVIWSPLVDRFGRRKWWICGCLAWMAASLWYLPGFDARSPSPCLWILLMSFCLASATQDIAIDAYTIGLVSKGEEGSANGVRVSAYRVALIFAGTALLFLPGLIGWKGVFRVSAALLGLCAASILFFPSVEVGPEARRKWLSLLRSWLGRPAAPQVFLFVLFYKLGDASMGPMITPFWLDSGLRLEELGVVSTGLGAGATIIGALAGGAFTDRFTLFTGLWALGLAQALSNLGYAAAAAAGGGRLAVYSASALESFTGGLGTAAFLAFLMRICDKENAAVQYAFLSSVFALSRDLSGAASGWAVTRLGYPAYFSFTFLLALPAFALLPWVRRWADSTPPVGEN